MGGVAVVTDTTADLPLDLAEERGVRVIPMTVTIGDEALISGVTLGSEEFYERLGSVDPLPTTSQPNPAWFEEAYADANDAGADAVVSIHLSAELSGTCDLARQVARQAALPVTVVDSRQAGAGLALCVLAATRASAEGAGVDEVAAVAERVADATRSWFVVDTLDYLRKGGRLSGAQALVGTVLKVKPILAFDHGRVEAFERVRTWSRAMERLAELAADTAGDAPVDVIVTHALAAERAASLWELLRDRLDVRGSLETVIGPVLGTHAGPGTVGVAIAPASG